MSESTTFSEYADKVDRRNIFVSTILIGVIFNFVAEPAPVCLAKIGRQIWGKYLNIPICVRFLFSFFSEATVSDAPADQST